MIEQIIFEGILFKITRGTNIFPLSKLKLLQNKASYVAQVKSPIITRFLCTIICKPSTKEWEQIPNPMTCYYNEAMAIMILHTKPLHYKIVRLSQHKGCQVIYSIFCFM